MTFKTEQEAFWAGEFGSEYCKRNLGSDLIASNLHFFSKALQTTSGIKNCIEFGANIGLNLQALKLLYPALDLHGIEINPNAAHELAKVIPPQNVYNSSILDFSPKSLWDLVLIRGVLIHINPDSLPEVYATLVAACNRFLLVVEYYSLKPEALPYRGHDQRLFKRDFAGEILDRHPQMQLRDYGFIYGRDPLGPGEDSNWFLLEKKS